MPFVDIKAAKEKRANLAQQMRSMVEEIGEPENWTDEKNAQFEAMNEDLNRQDSHIEKLERLEEIQPALEQIDDNARRDDFAANPKTVPDERVTHRDADLAFRAYCLGSDARPEQLAAAAKLRSRPQQSKAKGLLLPVAPSRARDVPGMYAELRATTDYMNVGTAADGGNVVPNDVMQAIEVFLVAYGGMRRSGARILRTATGGTLPIPTVDDTATTAIGALLAENTATTIHAFTLGQVTMGAYKYTSRLVGVSIELMQDSNFPLGPFLGETLGTRLGRITNAHFTVGETSDGAPQGVIAASTNSGLVGCTGSTYNNFTYAEVVTLLHSVDPAYRGSAACGWMFNDATLGLWRRLVDSDSRPLWLPSIVQDAPDTILGKPYTLNQDVPSFSTASTGNTKTIAFGAFDRYIIRDVMDIDLLRLNERYAEQGSVAFLAFQRTDGDLINRNAVKHFITATSS